MLRIEHFKLLGLSRPASFPALRGLISDTRFRPVTKLILAGVRIFIESARRVSAIGKRIRYRSYTTLGREMRAWSSWAPLLGLEIPGQSRRQQLDMILDAARYMGLFLSTPLSSQGASHEIEAYFMVGHIPGRTSLIWEEAGQSAEISVNGTRVSERKKNLFVWDRNNRIADISDIVRLGVNRVVIRSWQESFESSFPAIQWVEPLVVAGDFSVSMDVITGRRETTRHLVWGREGAGNYSGTITYRCTFRLPRRFAGRRAILDLGDVRVACRVRLNGHDLGARLWPPYRFELTDWLASEENSIEISVTNTAENLLGEPLPSGIVTDPKISFFDL